MLVQDLIAHCISPHYLCSASLSTHLPGISLLFAQFYAGTLSSAIAPISTQLGDAHYRPPSFVNLIVSVVFSSS